jgi:hypothetical protein
MPVGDGGGMGSSIAGADAAAAAEARADRETPVIVCETIGSPIISVGATDATLDPTPKVWYAGVGGMSGRLDSRSVSITA